MFVRSGTAGAEEATLLAPDGADGDLFGFSVALSSDASLALIGARTDDTVRGPNAGTARAFVRSGTTWAEEAVLLAPDGAEGANFGSAVALSANGARALVGSRATSRARVFARTGAEWVSAGELLASDAAAGAWLRRVGGALVGRPPRARR